MELLTHLENQCYRIALKGDLDASNSLLLDDALERAVACSPLEVQVNCRELDYISSAGLGVLISHLQNLTDSNISLTLCRMNPRIRDVFHLMGLEAFLTILPSHPNLPAPPPSGSLSH
jgi:anti-sigma B factor antagonist